MGKKTTPTQGMTRDPGIVRLTFSERAELYSFGRFINRRTQESLNLRIPFDVSCKDPLVAKNDPGLEIDQKLYVPWEPGIADGPTSARFAVVDYDSTTNSLTEPARWKRDEGAFYDTKGTKVDKKAKDTPQFRQVSTWAILQNTLDFFESEFGLGRRILWSFEGNRLIVVPHAGVGENAYYDRKSKSLQFYYFDRGGERIYTSLSSHIVNHAFGHAVLDGIRPYYLEAVSPETGAFHEFLGDLTAILMTLRVPSPFRSRLAARTKGDLSKNTVLSDLATELGVRGQLPYLRSRANKLTMAMVQGDLRSQSLSQVMTGAIFDIVFELSKRYIARSKTRDRRSSAQEALWYTTQRMQELAIQPLDLLPPVEVTFKDYAHAVLRNHQLSDPTDPGGYRVMMIDVFLRRGVLAAAEAKRLMEPEHVFKCRPGSVFHDVAAIASSRAEAYRFLDDNRDDLFIPVNADVFVSEVFTAEKMSRGGRRQPKQILLQYLWREEIVLDEPRFGRFSGKTTSLLCGATLALDQNGSLLAWSRKPGSQPTATALTAMKKKEAGAKLAGTEQNAFEEMQAGKARRAAYLDALASRIEAGMIGEAPSSEMRLLAKAMPLTSRVVDGVVRFELTPHFAIHTDEEDVIPRSGAAYHSCG